MSMILDIFVIVAFVIGISVNAKRGLVKSVLLVFGFIISIWLATFLSAKFSGDLYDSFFEKGVESKLSQKVAKMDSAEIIREEIFTKKLGVTVTTEEVREALLSDGDMVENLGTLAVSKKSGVDKKLVEKYFDKSMLFENSDAGIVEIAVNNEDFVHAVRILADEDNDHKSEVFYREIGRNYALKVTELVMTFLLYIIISSLISLIVNRINIFNKIPVVRGLNSILGGVVGVGEGFIIVMITALGIKVGTALLGFDDRAVYDTGIFKIFYDIFK